MEKHKNFYNSNKFKISAPSCSNEFGLLDESYSVSDIQDYFEYILKKHNKKIDNPSIRIYGDKIENRITFKIKTGYYLELLTPETMKDKNGENVPPLELTEVVLVCCNSVNKNH